MSGSPIKRLFKPAREEYYVRVLRSRRFACLCQSEGMRHKKRESGGGRDELSSVVIREIFCTTVRRVARLFCPSFRCWPLYCLLGRAQGFLVHAWFGDFRTHMYNLDRKAFVHSAHCWVWSLAIYWLFIWFSNPSLPFPPSPVRI